MQHEQTPRTPTAVRLVSPPQKCISQRRQDRESMLYYHGRGECSFREESLALIFMLNSAATILSHFLPLPPSSTRSFQV